VDTEYLNRLFSLQGQVAVITGGSGVLCSAIAAGYARAGAKIAILNRTLEKGEAVAAQIRAAGGEAMALACDVTQPEPLQVAYNAVMDRWGQVDILLNGAGGNRLEATTNFNRRFFDIPPEALRWVADLNLVGTILPCQAFGEVMAQQSRGVIINITSMSGFRPLTRVLAYSAAKAAVINFTQWLAVHLAQEYSPKLRVNALAPGFFLTDQNRYLLTEEKSGALTARGKSILAHTPMGRFGSPEDLVGTALWLASPAAAFVTGVVVAVDGGFNAFSGV
jgi:NAD(P)-dependent dehydrogenase (short-subunit alcohol dehydrogenase family)